MQRIQLSEYTITDKVYQTKAIELHMKSIPTSNLSDLPRCISLCYTQTENLYRNL